MIWKYIIERRSWIVLFITLQSLTLLIAYLDHSIPLQSIAYSTFLAVMIFLVFFMIRYKKETGFYRSLQEWEENLDLSSVADPSSPFEEIASESIRNQTEHLKKISNENMILLEEEKDDLLAWIHEVKTPLTAMHLMIERCDDEEMKSQLTYEWLRIHLLLDQQLHRKRMPFIDNDLFIEKVDLKTIIFKEIKTLQSWCIRKGIGFDIELEVTEVLSDSKWLGFIIRQLLTNAVKYSEDADILIRSYKENDVVKLDIQDFGRGIDPKDLSRIFDKGFTSTTHHQDNKATGMGLYLARKTAKPLSVSINVQSQVDEGTTFTVVFSKENEFVSITGM